MHSGCQLTVFIVFCFKFQWTVIPVSHNMQTCFYCIFVSNHAQKEIFHYEINALCKPATDTDDIQPSAKPVKVGLVSISLEGEEGDVEHIKDTPPNAQPVNTDLVNFEPSVIQFVDVNMLQWPAENIHFLVMNTDGLVSVDLGTSTHIQQYVGSGTDGAGTGSIFDGTGQTTNK